MTVRLGKITPQYNGYIQSSTQAITHTIYSLFNRYPEQIAEVKRFLQKSDKKTKMLMIGIAQGEEPLTHIQSALDVAKNKNKNISDVLDLTLIEAAEKMPIVYNADKYVDKQSVDYLGKLYQDTNKAHFLTPFETITQDLKKKQEKKDVILFNNVIQHINYGENHKDADKVLSSIGDLIDLVNENGLFCFTCEPLVLKQHPHINKYYNEVRKMLSDKGFINIESGVYKKINPNEISTAQRAQILGK